MPFNYVSFIFIILKLKDECILENMKKNKNTRNLLNDIRGSVKGKETSQEEGINLMVTTMIVFDVINVDSFTTLGPPRGCI